MISVKARITLFLEKLMHKFKINNNVMTAERSQAIICSEEKLVNLEVTLSCLTLDLLDCLLSLGLV